MAPKDDKQELIFDTPVFDSRTFRKRRSRQFTVVSLMLLLILFFCFVCMGFWFTNKRAYNRAINIFIIASKNESITAKLVSKPNMESQTTAVLTKMTEKYVSSELSITDEPRCPAVPDTEKFDCNPNGTITSDQCIYLGCCYQEVARKQYSFNESYFPPLGTPFCYYPPDYIGYEIRDIQKSAHQISAKLKRVIPSGFPNDIQLLDITISYIDENSLRIKITDSNDSRHEAPLNTDVPYKTTLDENIKYGIDIYENGSLVVARLLTKEIIFETNLRQLVYSDQFLQLSTSLPTEYVYGLGEHYDHLKKDIHWTRTPLFNRDNWPRADVLLYGSHPFYLGLGNDNSSYGVFLLNSNSMDIVLQPKPAITFRPIGGIFDFFVFLGPSPSEVIQQYTHIISPPSMPPYWGLGFHLCRYNYNSLNETRKVWQRTRDAGIPFDAQWNDIDYMMNHNDFTYDTVQYAGLPEFVKELHEAKMHYVVIIDPGITNTEKPGTYSPYDDGIEMDLFLKNSTGDLFIGKVWNPVSTVFPDFGHPRAADYWTKQFQMFHNIVPFDGAWIDMNEPSNFYDGQADGCPNTTLDNPPYVPGGIEPLRTHTVCMSAKHVNTTHYNEHNLYAYREAVATYAAMNAITGQRPFIISRASFPGQGKWSGHWSGDIGSTWEDMRYSVYDLLKFSLYGMPLMGSDICGFRLDTTVELCARWTTLGAFYPFSRNHNDKDQKDQDPVALGDVVVAAAKNSLRTRYNLLPYLYYLFYRSYVYGDTVSRPLFFEFINDATTYNIDEQFLWGPALMIIPALYPNMTTVNAYFPHAVWYDFYTGEKIKADGIHLTLDAPLYSINLALRGGYVIPQQLSASTTAESRKNSFFLVAGLDDNKAAAGELYWDDGVTIGTYENSVYNLISFTLQLDTFKSVVSHAGYATEMVLDFVRICGLNASPMNVTLNGYGISFQFDKYNCLQANVNVTLLEDFTLKWI